MVKKLRRVRGKTRRSLVSHGGYIHCPHAKLRFLVNPEVCKVNHFFWNREVLGIGALNFYEKNCRKCRAWTVAFSPEDRGITPKYKRNKFPAQAPKYIRVRRHLVPRVKEVRKRSPKDALAKTPRKKRRREVVN